MMTTSNSREIKEEITANAPCRIDFAGGTTDISFFVEDETGATLNAAIDIRATVSAVPADSFSLESKDLGKTLGEDLAYNGELDLFKAIIRKFGVPKLHIETSSQAPPGSGLGSSAAIGVALIGLLNEHYKKGMAREEIAELSYRLETQELNIVGGRQDQYAAVHGGINLFKFTKESVRQYPLEIGNYGEYLEKRLLLCYTGASRISGDANTKMRDNYLAEKKGIASSVEVMSSLRKIRDIAIEMYYALKEYRFEDFAELMNEETKYRANLHPDIVNEQIRQLIGTGINAGAIGAKVLGAGAGGCVVFYAAEEKRQDVQNSLSKSCERIIDFRFNYEGLCCSKNDYESNGTRGSRR